VVTVTLGLAIVVAYLFLLREPVSGSVVGHYPAPGLPSEVQGISGKSQIELISRDLEVQDKGGFPLAEGRRGGGFDLELSTTASACRRLKKLLGGGCGDTQGSSVPAPESFRVRVVRGTAPLRVEVEGNELRTLQMSQGSRATEQRVPTEWALREDARSTTLAFRCDAEAQIEISISPARTEEASAPCVPYGETYRVHVLHAGPFPAVIFASEVTLFTVEEMAAQEARLAIQDWKVAVDGSEGSFSPGPAQVAMHTEGTGLTFELRSSIDPPVEELTADTAAADSITVAGDERLKSWVERHRTIAILLFTVLIVPLLSWMWGVVWREDA